MMCGQESRKNTKHTAQKTQARSDVLSLKAREESSSSTWRGLQKCREHGSDQEGEVGSRSGEHGSGGMAQEKLITLMAPEEAILLVEPRFRDCVCSKLNGGGDKSIGWLPATAHFEISSADVQAQMYRQVPLMGLECSVTDV